MAGYGYAIIQLGQTNVPARWSTLEPFKIRAKHLGAVPYANGLQQFEVEVEIGTGTNQPDITDAELATLRLAVRGGADIPLIPSTLEGLLPDINGVTAPWGYKLERNDYVLAGSTNSLASNTNAATDAQAVRAAPGSRRFICIPEQNHRRPLSLVLPTPIIKSMPRTTAARRMAWSGH